MGDRADLHATKLTATGTVVGRRTRIRGIYAGAAGSIVLRDGGATGTTKLELTVGANTDYNLPGSGIVFDTDCHATLTTTSDVTFLYE